MRTSVTSHLVLAVPAISSRYIFQHGDGAPTLSFPIVPRQPFGQSPQDVQATLPKNLSPPFSVHPSGPAPPPPDSFVWPSFSSLPSALKNTISYYDVFS
jgi:hypothetical protein